MSRFALDTNIVLRLTDTSSPQYLTILKAISSLKEENHELFLSPQVLIEFWSVATRPLEVNGFGWPTEAVRSEIDKLLDLFPLLPETPAVFDEWLLLVTNKNKVGKQAHDARLAAFLNIHGITHLLTFNVADFKNYGITAVSPDEILAH
jgi:predicted nucleic acid-binding protein